MRRGSGGPSRAAINWTALLEGRSVATTYEFFKDFAGPIVTVVAAAAATVVTIKLGFKQVSIAPEQTRFAKANSRSAQQKIILDLFDKRWSSVKAIREGHAGGL